MLSKNSIKKVNSLQIKKYRKELGLFAAEGEKLVNEILNSAFEIESIYFTNEWNHETKNDLINYEEVTINEMKKISGLSTASSVLAVVRIPDFDLSTEQLKGKLTLALDDIQDPGNLGTIIRLADWFGISTILCSKGTVDVYSPKVVQATMGAITRVKVVYTDLNELIPQISQLGISVYGTFMEGDNIFCTDLDPNALVILGNEGNGISQDVEKLISKRLTIPNYSSSTIKSESLNVATATAIVCAEFRKRITS